MKKRAPIYAFMAYGAIGMLITGIVGPTFPLFLKSTGFPMAKIGLLISVAGFASAILSLFFGNLSDRFDRRRLFGISGLLLTGIPLLYYQVERAFSVVALRVMDGIAGPLAGVSSDSMLMDVAKSTGSKGAVLGQYRTIKSSMFVIGPMIGGLIISVMPIRKLFLVEAGLLAISMAIVLLAMRNVPAALPKPKGPIFSPPPLMKDQVVMALLGILLLDFLNFQVLITIFPVYAADLGVDYGFIGTLITVESLAYAALQYPIGRLTDSGKVLPLLIAGAILHGPLIWALTFSGSPGYWILIMALIGVASAPAFLAVMLTVTEAAGENTGAAMGLIGSTVYLASALGPLLSGLVSGFSMKLGFILPVVSSALTVFLAIAVVRWRRRHKQEEAVEEAGVSAGG